MTGTDTTTARMARRSMVKDGWTDAQVAAGAEDETMAGMMARSMRKDGWTARREGTTVVVTVDGQDMQVA